jgi:hypothetical protein
VGIKSPCATVQAPLAGDWLAHKPGGLLGLARVFRRLRCFSLISTSHGTSNLKQSIVRLRLVIKSEHH